MKEDIVINSDGTFRVKRKYGKFKREPIPVDEIYRHNHIIKC
jgi:hypothetical protein